MIAGETNRITQVTRRDIVDLLLLRSEPFHGRLGLVDFLRRVWNLSSLPSADSRFENAEGDIWQHMVSFRDWDYSYLLYDYLDILRSPDELFGKFLETCLHPLVVPDPYQAVPLCQDINARLRADGFELKPGPPISGRPVFKLQTVESQSPTEGEGGSHYEVVLSFAGEEREYVEEVAQILAASGVLVFYDKFERATLWGKDLSTCIQFTPEVPDTASCSFPKHMLRRSGQRTNVGARSRKQSWNVKSTFYRHDSTTQRSLA
jgi:hypothetical protein